MISNNRLPAELRWHSSSSSYPRRAKTLRMPSLTSVARARIVNTNISDQVLLAIESAALAVALMRSTSSVPRQTAAEYSGKATIFQPGWKFLHHRRDHHFALPLIRLSFHTLITFDMNNPDRGRERADLGLHVRQDRHSCTSRRRLAGARSRYPSRCHLGKEPTGKHDVIVLRRERCLPIAFRLSCSRLVFGRFLH